MKFRTLTALLVGIAITPAWGHAQIKLPIYEEESAPVKNVVFQEAKERGDFRHGKMIRVTLAGPAEKTVKGILVRVDPAKNRIFLRTEPGMPPLAIAEKDIKKIDKGVIKAVGFNQDYASPEIQTSVIVNGTKQTVSYYAPTLSPGEKSQLIEIENAKNELARLDNLASAQDQVMANDLALQAGQVRSQELMNDFFNKRELPGGYTNSNTGGTPYANYGYNLWPLPVGVTGGAGGEASNTFKTFSYPTNPVPFIRVGPTVFPNLSVSADALTKAQQRLAALQNRAVFENGHLVAVVLDDAK